MMARWIALINTLVLVTLATIATVWPEASGHMLLAAFISIGIAIGAIAVILNRD